MLQALFSYVFYEGTEEEKNINTVMELLRLSEVKEDDEELINIIKELYSNDVKKEKLLEIIDLVYKEAKDERD